MKSGFESRCLSIRYILCLALSFLLSACGPAVVVDENDVVLTLLTPESVVGNLKDTSDLFEDKNSSSDRLSSVKEGQIAMLCGDKGPVTGGVENLSSAILGIPGVLLDSTVSFIFEQISNSLKETLKRYTSAYAASQADFFYANRISDEEKTEITQEHTCIRLKRKVKVENGKTAENKPRTLDFIAQIRMVNSSPEEYEGYADVNFEKAFVEKRQAETGFDATERQAARKRKLAKWHGSVNDLEYLRVTPLRLAIDGMAAESKDRRFTVTIGLKIESTWFQDIGGHQAEIEKPVLTKKVKLSEQDRIVQYYFDEIDEKNLVAKIRKNEREAVDAESTILPLPAYSSGYLQRDVTDGSGWFRLEVGVAEAGVPPAELEAAIAIFGKSSDDLAGLLSDALKSNLGWDDDE